MTHNTMTRAGAALALMALLVAGSTAAVAGERRTLGGERRAAVAARSGETGLFAQAWRWLVSVWGKEGSLIDPNGVKPPSPPPPAPLETPQDPSAPLS